MDLTCLESKTGELYVTSTVYVPTYDKTTEKAQELIFKPKRNKDIKLDTYGKLTEDKIMKSLEMFDKLYENMTEEEKKETIRVIVSEVTVLEEPRGNNYIKDIYFKFSLDKNDHLDYVMDGSILDDVEDLSIDYK